MTQSRNIDLSPEEQAELAENMPQLLDAIEKGSSVAGAWLASWRSKRSVADEAREQAEELQREVAAAVEAAGPEQASIAQWCGFPTDMTRCSPFFPMNVKELGQRRYLERFLITSASWGEIHYSGPQLSTYEEDILMVILAILDKNTPYKTFEYGTYEDVICCPGDSKEVLDNARKTFAYHGPVLPILKMLGYSKPNKKDYQRLINSLERMETTALRISISTGKTKSGRRREPRKIQITNMLSAVLWDEKKKELFVAVNPFFYETYLAGRVTFMDVAKRMELKGVIAKALYRFVQSQRQNPIFVGHFLTLADALNMDREQPAYQLRRQLKTAINELVRQGVLVKKSGFVDTDLLKLNRTPEALPSKETKILATY